MKYTDRQRDILIARAKQAIRYGPQQYREDWETALALAQLMAIHGPIGKQEQQLESCFIRINAYSQMTGDLPFDRKGRDCRGACQLVCQYAYLSLASG